ncbi:hypothetical protein CH063_13378, partial [Colletotrichum higginsianum]
MELRRLGRRDDFLCVEGRPSALSKFKTTNDNWGNSPLASPFEDGREQVGVVDEVAVVAGTEDLFVKRGLEGVLAGVDIVDEVLSDVGEGREEVVAREV